MRIWYSYELLLSSFELYSIPFCFRFFVDKESFHDLDQTIQKGLFLFACTNSVMDPIVYGFFNLKKNNSNRNQVSLNYLWPNSYLAVWVLENFSSTLILREISCQKWLYVNLRGRKIFKNPHCSPCKCYALETQTLSQYQCH